jgi:Zn-dependent protease with chaperone function
MALDPRLCSPKERPLFVLSAIFSGIVWLVVVVTIVGLVYGGLIAMFIAMAHAIFLAHVHGNGVRVSEKQHPELYVRIRAGSARLGLPRTPEVYLLQGGGLLNAFATKLFSRRFVILLSDLVDQCADPRQLDFVVGHELAHHAAGHLAWNVFLAPAHVVPLLGPAYSRAKEYTCDRAGAAVAGDTEQAMRGLVVLASGGKLAAATNLDAFMEQAAETGGFWASVAELAASHPFLCKRVLALKEWVAPGTARPPGRSPLAYLFAPFFGFASAPTAAGGALVMVAVIGMLAAIAIPNFVKYQERAREAAAAQQQLEQLREPPADPAAPPAGAPQPRPF